MMGGAFVTNVAEKLQEICKKKIDTEVKIRYTYIRWCEFISNSKFNTCIMREWLSGGAPPCQGGGRGFDPRLALFLFLGKPVVCRFPSTRFPDFPISRFPDFHEPNIYTYSLESTFADRAVYRTGLRC
jgi:hypothetical protein